MQLVSNEASRGALDALRIAGFAIAGGLIVVGVWMAIKIFGIGIQLFTEPEAVPLIEWVVLKLSGSAGVLSGVWAQEAYSFEFSPGLMGLLAIMLVFGLIGTLGGIGLAILRSAVSLIKALLGVTATNVRNENTSI